MSIITWPSLMPPAPPLYDGIKMRGYLPELTSVSGTGGEAPI